MAANTFTKAMRSASVQQQRGLRMGGQQGRRTLRLPTVCNATALPLDIKKVTPVGGRTFLKVEEVKEETQGGILLPDQAQTKQTQGVVVVADADVGFEVGNNVVFSKFAGTELELEGKEHVLLKVSK